MATNDGIPDAHNGSDRGDGDAPRQYIGIGIALGVAIGTALSVATQQPAMIGIGLAIGIALGVALSRRKPDGPEPPTTGLG